MSYPSLPLALDLRLPAHRLAIDVDEKRLGQPKLVGQPRSDERSDEAQRDRDQAAAARSSGDRAADRARDRGDQEVDQKGKEREVHFGRRGYPGPGVLGPA